MRTKRVISLFLSLVMLFALSVPVLAAEPPEVPQLSSAELIDGTIYVHETSVQRTVVTVPENDTWVEIDFCLTGDPGTVYQFFVENVTVSGLNTADSADWEWILEACEAQQATAEQIAFSRSQRTDERSIEEGSSTFSLDSLIGYALTDALAEQIGEYPYEDELHYMTSIYGGQDIKIYERMDFRFEEIETFDWDDASGVVTLGAFITEKLGLPITTKLLEALAGIFDLAAYASTVLPDTGSVTQYECVAYIARLSKINGSAYPYVDTEHVIIYQLYDNNDINNPTLPEINDDSFEEYYTHSQTYFNSYSIQAQDAYNAFLTIGQQP